MTRNLLRREPAQTSSSSSPAGPAAAGANSNASEAAGPWSVWSGILLCHSASEGWRSTVEKTGSWLSMEGDRP